jgi:hypothetical protein
MPMHLVAMLPDVPHYNILLCLMLDDSSHLSGGELWNAIAVLRGHLLLHGDHS